MKNVKPCPPRVHGGGARDKRMEPMDCRRGQLPKISADVAFNSDMTIALVPTTKGAVVQVYSHVVSTRPGTPPSLTLLSPLGLSGQDGGSAAWAGLLVVTSSHQLMCPRCACPKVTGARLRWGGEGTNGRLNPKRVRSSLLLHACHVCSVLLLFSSGRSR